MNRLAAVLALLVTVAVTGVMTTSPADADSTARWSRVSAGGTHTCGIQSGGALYCWGSNGTGELGLADTTDRMTPARIGSATWSAVSAVDGHTCAIRVSGSLFCWGANNTGQLGTGDTTDRSSPRQVGTAHWTAVSVSGGHTCAVRDSGSLYCWGYNTYGQVGDGTTTTRLTPRKVGSSTSWVQVTVSSTHTCAKTSGRVYCWGFNFEGQLGNGGTAQRTTPQRVGGASDWAQISAGGAHTCGIRATSAGRTLYCWGSNTDGQYGDGTKDSRRTPTVVGTSRAWINLGAGSSHQCGVRSSSRLVYCAGYNNAGQLGDGTTNQRSTTAPEARGFSWQSVEGGTFHTCAIRSSNLYLYCWGYNFYGQLGDGTTTSRLKAVRVS